MSDKKPVSPEISKYFSELAKKRKNPYHGFQDKTLAKKAGDIGRETQRAKRQEAISSKDDSQS